MIVQILNSLSGDNEKDIDTSTDDGRAAAKKLVDELIRSGSAVFLEKDINGEKHTYRVTGYDPITDKLTIKLNSASDLDAGVTIPKKRGPYSKSVVSSSGAVVSVAPRAGG